MNIYIFLGYTLLISFQLCSKSFQDTQKDLKWVDCQTLCVYWTDLAERKFKTAAVIFKLTSSTYLNTEYYDFYFEDNLITNQRLKLEKISQQKYGESYALRLVLDNELLKPFLKEDDFPKGAPCYDGVLKDLIEVGSLIYIKKNQEAVVKKSIDFAIYIGPK